MGLTCSLDGSTNEMGIRDVDVVVLSVPYTGVTTLLKSLLPHFNDQIVISLVVPMKKNKFFEYTPPKQGSAALEIRDVLPKTVKVVSAYHNVSAKKLRTRILSLIMMSWSAGMMSLQKEK